ncbi:TIGR01440 family protein [Alkalibacillus aidingensis]|uniref:TIGR01440 family protein n=1 Tax=Alkalibacillus aidingensis TaxID=2747607 RepID=UPI00374E1B62
MVEIKAIQNDLHAIIKEWDQAGILRQGGVFVLGCSTSEIAGERIGTSGSTEIAQVIFDELKAFQNATGVHIVYQCCEHLNRAIVMERSLQEAKGLDVVNAVPHPSAGGSMAAYAYEHMEDPVLVEHIQADYGMDIGDTLIGMHLKHVAVPLRFTQKTLGDAHVTYAYTRPKLIGGERAKYC